MGGKSSIQEKKSDDDKSKSVETERRRSNDNNKKRHPFLLNERQKQILVKSWRRNANFHNAEHIGVRIYFKVFDACPEVKQIFGLDHLNREQLLFNDCFQRQAKLIVKQLDDAIRDIDRLQTDVQVRLFALGARHAKYRSTGFKLQHWDAFAECMLEAIIDAQGVHKYRETTATWRIFIVWLIGVMKQGYYDALRNERRPTVPAAGVSGSDPPTEQHQHHQSNQHQQQHQQQPQQHQLQQHHQYPVRHPSPDRRHSRPSYQHITLANNSGSTPYGMERYSPLPSPKEQMPRPSSSSDLHHQTVCSPKSVVVTLQQVDAERRSSSVTDCQNFYQSDYY